MKFLFISALVFWQNFVFGQDHMGFIKGAEAFFEQKNYVEALTAYKKAFKISQIDGNDFYRGACAAARTGDKTLAFKWLHLAVKQCFLNIEALKSSESLQPLQQDKRWQPLLRTMQQKLNQTDTLLQTQLIDIQQNDQNNRIHLSRISKKYGYDSDTVKHFSHQMEYEDSLNLIQVRAVLDKYGWLGADQIGSLAVDGLWRIIQHSTLPVQQKYLPLLRATARRKQASMEHLALLEDKVAVREGRKQWYGTQFRYDPIMKISHLEPLDAPELVDKRRATMGMEPLSATLKENGVKCTAQEYPKQK
ncbi:MAG: hypothetical protein RLZZ628_1912 [Bacteroidota bacterium]|jgi:tetratricopeptide (TPR) repeat protein